MVQLNKQMANTKAQEKAIREKYSEEGEINKSKKSRFDEEGEGDHKEDKGYRTKEDSKEKAGKMDKEGKAKCSKCGK